MADFLRKKEVTYEELAQAIMEGKYNFYFPNDIDDNVYRFLEDEIDYEFVLHNLFLFDSYIVSCEIYDKKNFKLLNIFRPKNESVWIVDETPRDYKINLYPHELA